MKRLTLLTPVLFLAGVCAIALPAQHTAPAEAPEGESQQHGEESDHTTLWKFANFLILAGAAGYFLYKKGGTFFAGRTAGIQRGLAEAAQLKAQAEARYADIERRLASLGAEIEALRQRAGEETGLEHARVCEETERDLRKIQAQAEQEIAATVKSARQQLRAYSAELAVGLAAGKIRARLTPETDRALVASMVREVGSRRPDAGRVS